MQSKLVFEIAQQHHKSMLFFLVSLGFVAIGLWAFNDPEFIYESAFRRFVMLLGIPFFGLCALVFFLSLIGLGPRTKVTEHGLELISLIRVRREAFEWPTIGAFHASTQRVGVNNIRYICAFDRREEQAASTSSPPITPDHKNATILIPLNLTPYGSSDETTKQLAKKLNALRKEYGSENLSAYYLETENEAPSNKSKLIKRRAMKRRLFNLLSIVGAIAFFAIGPYIMARFF